LEDAQVMGSRRDLAIAVRNLLENAVRHTSPGGDITVATRIEGAEVTVAVTDSGEGIPTRDHERVFERFYRVDSARARESGGTGLGLAIVIRLIEAQSGTIELLERPGGGTIARVTIPLARS
jgi:signal transduction histidine kinase